jgi:hypothetical protein
MFRSEFGHHVIGVTADLADADFNIRLLPLNVVRSLKESTPATARAAPVVRSSRRRQHLAQHAVIHDPAHPYEAVRLIDLDGAVVGGAMRSR